MPTPQATTPSSLPPPAAASSSPPPSTTPAQPPAPQAAAQLFPPGFLKKLEPYTIMNHPGFDPARSFVYSSDLVAVSSFRSGQEWDAMDRELYDLQRELDIIFEKLDKNEGSRKEQVLLRARKLVNAWSMRKLFKNGAGIAYLRGAYLAVLRQNHLSESEAEAVLREEFGRSEFVPLDKIVEACLRRRDDSPALDSPDTSFSDDDDGPATPDASVTALANAPSLGIEQALSEVSISHDIPSSAASFHKPYCLYKCFPDYAESRSPEILAAKEL